jgi:hypothetical protein
MATMNSRKSQIVSVSAILVFQFLVCVAIIATMDFCCDAGYYLQTGGQLLSNGIYATYPYDGHRSYLTPILVSGIHRLPFADWLLHVITIDGYQRYATNMLILNSTCSAFALWALAKRVTSKQLVMLSLFTFCNPVLLGHVLLPMQESAMLFVFVPLYTLLCFEFFAGWRLALCIALTSYAYMVRESYAFVLVPLALLYIYPMLAKRKTAQPQSRPALALAIIGSLLMIAPQMIRNQKLYNSFRPYHSENVQDEQMLWGTRMYKYSTEKLDGNWKGVQYVVPEKNIASNTSLISALLHGEGRAIPTILTHMYVGVIHDQVGPYGPLPTPQQRLGWVAYCTVILTIGALGVLTMLVNPTHRSVGLSVASLVFLSWIYTAFVATESRFGILGFLALGLSVQAFVTWPGTVARKWTALASVIPLTWLAMLWINWLDLSRQVVG